MKPIQIIAFTLVVFFTACENPKALPNGKLRNSKWFCLSELNDTYKATVRLEFNGENNTGNVEAYEDMDVLPSCVCNGNYKLNEDRKTLTISGISNENCPWMARLNGTYTFSKDDKMLRFNNGDIIIATAN